MARFEDFGNRWKSLLWQRPDDEDDVEEVDENKTNEIRRLRIEVKELEDEITNCEQKNSELLSLLTDQKRKSILQIVMFSGSVAIIAGVLGFVRGEKVERARLEKENTERLIRQAELRYARQLKEMTHTEIASQSDDGLIDKKKHSEVEFFLYAPNHHRNSERPSP